MIGRNFLKLCYHRMLGSSSQIQHVDLDRPGRNIKLLAGWYFSKLACDGY